MNDEAARPGRHATTSSLRRTLATASACETLTQLQVVLSGWSTLQQQARTTLGAREYAAFVAVLTIYAAGENARFLDEERAA
jgi:hypothetical protein